MSTFLWGVFPYLAMAVFVVGLIWRYKYDKFGWTTRSSQLYESKMLRIGSPLFSHCLFGVYLGLMLWGGLWLRDPRLRALIPLRAGAGA